MGLRHPYRSITPSSAVASGSCPAAATTSTNAGAMSVPFRKRNSTPPRSIEAWARKPSNRFQFVADHQRRYGVKRLCAILGIARSSFSYWHGTSADRAVRQAADATLATRIRAVHRDSDGPYGAARITGLAPWSRARRDYAVSTPEVDTGSVPG